MTRARLVAWVMVAVWGAWLSAAQGVLAARTVLGVWTPDLGLVLLVACVGRFPRREAVPVVLLVSLARIAFTIEPPTAILAGFLGASLAVQGVRLVVEVDTPLVRGIVGFALALGFGLWLALVHGLRADGVPTSPLAALGRALPGALSTGIVTLATSGVLPRLPGLSPLQRERW